MNIRDFLQPKPHSGGSGSAKKEKKGEDTGSSATNAKKKTEVGVDVIDLDSDGASPAPAAAKGKGPDKKEKLAAKLKMEKEKEKAKKDAAVKKEAKKKAVKVKKRKIVEDDDDDEEDDGGFEVTSKAKGKGGEGKHPAKRARVGAAAGAGFGGPVADAKEEELDAAEAAKQDNRRKGYAKFVSRGGPPNAGVKDRPVGARNCLAGHVFVITGVLDSLERDECADLVKEYGGRVVSAVSGKVTHGIVGTEAGDSKVKKLTDKGLPMIDEDQLFHMISKTGPKRKAGEKKEKMSVDDDDDEVKDVDMKNGGDDSDSEMIDEDPAPKKKAVAKSKSSAKPPKKSEGDARPTSAPALPSAPIASSSMLWADKYRPVGMDELVANPKICEQMGTWLRGWKARRHAFLANESGGGRGKAKAIKEEERPVLLLAGPPGIGKTTAAHAVCRSNGFDPNEYNASETRNKSSVQGLSNSIMIGGSMKTYFATDAKDDLHSSFLKGAKKVGSKGGKKAAGASSKPGSATASVQFPHGQVLIMDEVDGMSSGDRGGSQELVKFFKTSKVPIICICNDDSSTKMRALANHCFKLKFRRPTPAQVRDRLLYIAKREGFTMVDDQTIERLAEGCNGDIRQMVNMLQTWRLSSSKLSFKDVTGRLSGEGKTFETIGTFGLMQSFFDKAGPRNTIFSRFENYFQDSDMMPLFVAENYTSTSAAKAFGRSTLALVADAAESISDGDIANSMIRVGQRWDLMPAVAVMSCVLPGQLMGGGMGGRIAFPATLGNISKRNKNLRLTREIENRVKTAGTSSASIRGFRLDYMPTLAIAMATPLISGGASAIPDVIERLDAYCLPKEDWNSVLELYVAKTGRSPIDAVPGAVKAGLTREFNKVQHETSTMTNVKIGLKGKSDAAVTKTKAPVVTDAAKGDNGSDADDDDSDAEANSDVELEQFKVKGKGKTAAKGKSAKKPGKGRAKK